MRCRDFINQLDDYLEGGLTKYATSQCSRHVAACADCKSYLDSYLLTISLVRKSAMLDVPSENDVLAFNRRILDTLPRHNNICPAELIEEHE